MPVARSAGGRKAFYVGFDYTSNYTPATPSGI